jgi:hypothetical protein
MFKERTQSIAAGGVHLENFYKKRGAICIKTDFGYGYLTTGCADAEKGSLLTCGFARTFFHEGTITSFFRLPTHTQSRISCNIGGDFCKFAHRGPQALRLQRTDLCQHSSLRSKQ